MANDGAGLIDLLGREVLPCQYNSLSAPHCGLLYCRRKPGGQREYIDLAGKTVIALGPNRVGDPFDPATGLARVMETRDGLDYYGFIDTAGRPVVPPIFASASYPAEGLFQFKSHEKSGLFGFADLSGKVVIPPRFHRVASVSFSCGLALVSYPGDPAEYYFIDHAGKHVFGPVMLGGVEYSDVLKEHGAVLLYEPKTHQQYVMDRSGRTLLKAPPGVDFHRIYEGLIQAQHQRTKKFGYLDLTGRWVVEPKYDSVLGPSGGYIRVTTDDGIDLDNPGGSRLNERHGLVDTAGRVVAPLGKWSSVGFPGCGRAGFCEETAKGSLDGYISLPSGEVVIPAKFQSAGTFSEGFATVRVAG